MRLYHLNIATFTFNAIIIDAPTQKFVNFDTRSLVNRHIVWVQENNTSTAIISPLQVQIYVDLSFQMSYCMNTYVYCTCQVLKWLQKYEF